MSSLPEKCVPPLDNFWVKEFARLSEPSKTDTFKLKIVEPQLKLNKNQTDSVSHCWYNHDINQKVNASCSPSELTPNGWINTLPYFDPSQRLAMVQYDIANNSRHPLYGYKLMEIMEEAKYFQFIVAHQLMKELLTNTPKKLVSNKNITNENLLTGFGHNDNKYMNFSKRLDSYRSTSSLSEISSIGTSRSSRSRGELFCSFCKANKETFEVFTSHILRDKKTRVLQCPILRKIVCPICSATEDGAHTLSYCPVKKALIGKKPNSVMHQIMNSQTLASGIRRK